jgi:hypothetical protein
MTPTRQLNAPEPPAEPLAQADAAPVARGRLLTETKMLEPSRPPEQEHDTASVSVPAPSTGAVAQFACGWLVVVQGPLRGASFPLHEGLNTIGRATKGPVGIDLGDDELHPGIHAVLAYDPVTRFFHINHAGQTALVRLNGMPVLGPGPLTAGDQVQIGVSVMVFVPFCGPDFDWQPKG